MHHPHWRLLESDPAVVESLSTAAAISPFLARLLVNRGIRTVDDARRFLQPSLGDLRSPLEIKDGRTAAGRIHRAVENGEKILIFSDYDADGITSAVVLCQFLRDIGARVNYYIPHRLHEGYGFHESHIRSGILGDGVGLVITADCGISSAAAVDAARQTGIDVIVTDHHHVPEVIPRAAAVVNPKQPGCPSGLGDLAGVGIAFMLVICLRAYLREKGFWRRRREPNLKAYYDLVAIGTLADAVPLAGENRILSRFGLQQIQSAANRPGIEALLQAVNAAPRTVTAEDLVYKIVPRINAAGRMDHAGIAAEMLMTKDRRRARELAGRLEILNRRRKATEDDILQEIRGRLADKPALLNRPSLVLHGNDWHEGVLGIVASKLVEAYLKPVVLVSVRNGMGKGSARSLPGVDLFQCLSQCGRYLETYGGHALAAGIQIHPDNLPAFTACFDNLLNQSPNDLADSAGMSLEAEIPLNSLTDDMVDAVESLMPFGNGNPEPVFMARRIEVVRADVVGQHHLRMQLRPKDGPRHRILSAIQFNVDPQRTIPASFEALAFRLRWNRWGGKKTVQLMIEASRP